MAASVSRSARLALHFRADGSAGLKGFQLRLLKGFDQVAIPAFMVLLGEGKQAHQNQGRQDTSGYHVLHHGCHSTGDRAAKDDEPMGAAVNAPGPPHRANPAPFGDDTDQIEEIPGRPGQPIEAPQKPRDEEQAPTRRWLTRSRRSRIAKPTAVLIQARTALHGAGLADLLAARS